jgi:hypothetical protein
VEQVLSGEVGPVEGEEVEKGIGGWICNWETCWNDAKNGGEEIKENDGEGKLKYDIVDTL